MTKKQALERVAELSARVEKTELNLSRWKWKRADAMLDAYGAGASYREIGKAAGVSISTVELHLRLCRKYQASDLVGRPAFREAVEAVHMGSDIAKAREAQARTTLANPESRRRVLDSMPAEHVRDVAIDASIRNERQQDKHRPHPTPAERARVEDDVALGVAPLLGELSRWGLADTVSGMRDAAAAINRCLDNHGMTVALLDQLEAAYGELTEAMLRARELADIQSL